MLDLSLSDALTDSPPQPGPESKVERDFVAQLEAEAFDDQVKETVGKTDYIPLLDDDDKRTFGMFFILRSQVFRAPSQKMISIPTGKGGAG
uniref:Uncharacterized protein n=1 Tax=Fundulus heteroclitus TaxID=8078 RepID=A0A3Q2NZP1_FUNHE